MSAPVDPVPSTPGTAPAQVEPPERAFKWWHHRPDDGEKALGDARTWVGKNILTALTFAALLTYAAIRISMNAFYSRFGLEPEDVGLDYSATLSRAVIGFVFFAIVTFLILMPLTWGVARVVFYEQGEIHRLIVVGAAVAISTIFLVYVLATGYATNAANLRRGQELNFSFLDNPLQLRATTLDLDWAGTRPEIVRYCNCSIHYLGHANSLAVLYDSTHDRTLRIPESDLRFRSTP